jgi:hypothetical protein
MSFANTSFGKTPTHPDFPNHDLSIPATRRQEPPIMTPLQHPHLIRMLAQHVRRHARERAALARVVREEGHGRFVVVVRAFELLVFPGLVKQGGEPFRGDDRSGRHEV